MTKRITELLLLGLFLVVAIALHRSTSAFPDFVQNSTAAYVRFLGISLGLLVLLEVGLCLTQEAKEKKIKLDLAKAPVKFWSLLILMTVYSSLLEPLGFYLASLLFLPVTMYVMGTRSKLQILFTSLGVLLFVYLVFQKFLGVPLPESSLMM